MVQKDKPILSPFWIFRPSRYLDPERFPLWVAFGFWALIQAISWLEPIPPELNIKFSLQYRLLQHGCAILAEFLVPLILVRALPIGQKGGRILALVRLSMGASFWYLWTFPLTFLFHGIIGAASLELLRPFLWAATIAVAVSAPRPPERKVRSAGWAVGGTFGIYLGAIAVSMLPELQTLANFRIDKISSGKIIDMPVSIPRGWVVDARWDVQGTPELVTRSRLELGGRQEIIGGSDGHLGVVVGMGTIPAPADTTGTLTFTASPRLAALVAKVQAGNDTSRLRALHALVHGSIAYQRKYIQGTSEEILQRGNGDCKAYAQVFTDGARALGFRAKAVHGIIANEDGYYAHAWTTVFANGRWEDWDPTSTIPFPDGRYLRFSMPEQSNSSFDGELAIFSLKSIRFQAVHWVPFRQ